MNKDFFYRLFYSKEGWFFIKLFIGVRWFLEVGNLLNATTIIKPVGLCKILPCDILSNSIVMSIALGLSLFTISIYIFYEKYALPSILTLLILSLFMISFHESTGVFLRASLFSMIWVGQLAAYIFHKNNIEDLKKFRHQYVIQLICATYFLAALTKLSDAGWAWPQQGSDYFSISSLKGYLYDYFDTGNATSLNEGYKLAYLILGSKHFVYWLMFGALLLEFTSPLAALDRRLTFFYGIMFLLLHIGIEYTMSITIGGTYYSMLAFMLNPLGLLYFSFKYLKEIYLTKRSISSI